MKYTIAALLAAPVLGLALLGASTASAMGPGGFSQLSPTDIATRVSAQFQNEATTLGISVDALKSGWAQGKTLREIASDNGISADQLQAKLKASRQAQMTSVLQALVSQGVITQAQMDQRIAAMAAARTASNGNTTRGMKGHGGPHGRGMVGLGFGF